MGKRFFPGDVEKALYAYLHNPAASTCTDAQLYKALYRYDEHKPGFKLVDDLDINQYFETEDGEVYQKLEKLRTRTRCRNLNSGRVYFFQGIVEVKAIRKKYTVDVWTSPPAPKGEYLIKVIERCIFFQPAEKSEINIAIKKVNLSGLSHQTAKH